MRKYRNRRRSRVHSEEIIRVRLFAREWSDLPQGNIAEDAKLSWRWYASYDEEISKTSYYISKTIHENL